MLRLMRNGTHTRCGIPGKYRQKGRFRCKSTCMKKNSAPHRRVDELAHGQRMVTRPLLVIWDAANGAAVQLVEFDLCSGSSHSQNTGSSASSIGWPDARPFGGRKQSLDDPGRNDGSEPRAEVHGCHCSQMQSA